MRRSANYDSRWIRLLHIKHYHERYLRAAIDSVLQQTCPAWDLLLLVDEARMAHFRDLLAGPLGDPRVRLVARQGRLLGGAYNSAMRAAETEFIAVLLGDDALSRYRRDADRAHPAHPGVTFLQRRNLNHGDDRASAGLRAAAR